MNCEKNLLFILSRNYGDAIIQLNYINLLKQNLPEYSITVWSRANYSILIDYKYKKIISSFLIFKKDINSKSIYSFFKAVYKILTENTKYIVILFYPDIREYLIANLINPKKIINFKCGNSSNLKKNFRQIFYKANIVFNEKNIYLMYDTYCKYIISKLSNKDSSLIINSRKKNRIEKNSIGLHPFSSLKLKTWELSNWIKLYNLLLNDFHEVYVYCDVHNYSICKLNFKSKHIKLLSSDKFIKDVGKNKINICNDSFAAHASFLEGSQTVVLFGPTDPVSWCPPESIIIKGESGCKFQPCFGIHSKGNACINDNKGICMRSIDENLVYKVIKKLNG